MQPIQPKMQKSFKRPNAIKFIVCRLLGEAIKSRKRICASSGFLAEELLESITRLSKHRNNAEELIKLNMFTTFAKIIKQNACEDEVK